MALLSATRYEWPILDFAILSVGALTVPIYETSSAEQVRFVLADSGAVLVFAETDAHADTIEQLKGELPELRKVLRIDGIGTVGARCAGRGGQVGRRRASSMPGWPGSRPADPATLIYTSGTTGRPKGCQLTHSNLVYEIRGAKASFPTLLDKGERLLVFLPLAHVLARAITIAAFANKVTLGFTSDIKNLVPMFGVFKPTLVVSVPRVFEKVYNTAEQNARNDGKGRIFEIAVEHRDRVEPGAGQRRCRACCCGPSTRCSTGWSTASCAPRSAATATPRSPVARRWAPGSATSTAVSG